MDEIKICTAGDSSVLIEFRQKISPEINAQITALVRLIKAQHIEGVTDMIPAFASLLINYDPRVVSYAGLRDRLEKLLKLEISGEVSESRIFEIPVCYGGEYGPDLENIADHAGLTPEEVIGIHSAKDYAGIPARILLSGRPGREDPHSEACQSADPHSGGKRGDRGLADRDLSAGLTGRLAASRHDAGKDIRSRPGSADPL